MKTNLEIREWVVKELYLVKHSIRQCEEVVIEEKHIAPMLAAGAEDNRKLYDSQRGKLEELLAFIDEPEELQERVFHLGGFWGDEYYDQDGIASWLENPKRKND
jgi:hypothetical protein